MDTSLANNDMDIITELRHKYNSPVLEDEIANLAPTENASKRFLIKMEIMNLSRSVSRVIDLRAYFSNACDKYQYNGISHFLDQIAMKEFETEISKYRGVYTLGVYEYVISQAKKRHKLNSNTTTFPTTKSIHLTKFIQRKELQLDFNKPVSLFFNSPEKMSSVAFTNFAICAFAKVLTNNTLTIKVPTDKIIRATGLVYVWMHGIENEYDFSERVIITYKIEHTYTEKSDTYLNLNYHYQQFCNVTEQFLAYASQYVEIQKKLADIPNQNTFNAVMSKAAEQFIISRLNSLPVFLSSERGYWLPSAQFKTQNNGDIGLFENSKDNNDFLRACCALPYIQTKLSIGERFIEYIFILPITDKQGKTYYIALPHSVLLVNNFIKKIARGAKQKKQLRLYRIDGGTTSPESECYVPSCLPLPASELFENINQAPFEYVKSLVKKLKRMLVISDFSDAIDYLNLLDECCDNSHKSIHLPEYILQKPGQQSELFSVNAETSDFRIEDRFFDTISIHLKKRTEIVDEFIDGVTMNISTRGLKIKLTSPIDLNIGNHVLIRFPELLSKDSGNSKYHPYHVVGQDSALEYRLYIEGNTAHHSGRKLLRSYISKNINNLRAMSNEHEIYGLSRALRNIFANNIHVPYGLTARYGAGRYIQNIALSSHSDLPPVKSDTPLEILNLMNTDSFRSLVVQQLDIINKENPYNIFYCVVMPRIKSNGDKYFFIKQIQCADKNVELTKLLDVLRCIGEPRVLRISSTKKGRVFNKYFRDEIAYLERFSATKIKDIDALLRNVQGIFEMVDITDIIHNGNGS
ncbi:hypothetical protein [Psychromonas sp. MME2]|uniref:hypothetical protein n=1 Tax=unclassified Psychromonas TaxID=2614957 RepID=UPI00339CC37C